MSRLALSLFILLLMLTGGDAPAANPFDLPPWLERLYKWSRGLLVLATILAFVVGIFVGSEKAGILAWVLVVFFVVLHFLSFLIRRSIRGTDLAEKVLSTTESIKPEDQKTALQKLLRAKRDAQIAFVFLLAAAVTPLALLLYQPAYYMLCTVRPKTVEVESVRYFDPTPDSALFKQSPFLEALTAYLAGEGKNTRIVLATTKAFLHPTPHFQLAISLDDPARVIAGYAFHQHRERERVFYEPVELSYAQAGSVAFSLPPCDPGDQVFFLGRLSLAGTKDSFPLDLREAIKFSVLEEH